METAIQGIAGKFLVPGKRAHRMPQLPSNQRPVEAISRPPQSLVLAASHRRRESL
jgi:hypothetical protein